jgi:hypothetical protein
MESAIDTYRKILTRMMERAINSDQRKSIFIREMQAACCSNSWTNQEICALANEIKNKYGL